MAKSSHKTQHTAKYPPFASHPVRIIPIVFICQCPWQLNAYRIVLSAFWQIITDHDQYHSHQRIYPDCTVYALIVKCITINSGTHINRYQRTDTEHQTINFRTDILSFGIHTCHQCTKYMCRQTKQINPYYRKQPDLLYPFGVPSVPKCVATRSGS